MSLLVVSYGLWYSATSMAQAWHKQREQLSLAQGAEAQWWRASKYELVNVDIPMPGKGRRMFPELCIEAASDARWERFTPFDSYRPTTRVRVVESGPHLAFLRLKGLWEDESDLFSTALQVFATKYGLLGVFEEEYYWPPALPRLNLVVAPEAVIDSQGKLRRIDPATEGKELLWNALRDSGRPLGETLLPPGNKMNYVHIALPSEIQ